MLTDPTENRDTIKRLYNRMDELLYREEMMWLQRSRISWLREGDRNTGFFHRKATWRSKKNKIRRLISEDNRYVENKGEMEAMATKFFQDLYMKDASIRPKSIASMIETRLTQDMNETLCKPFTDEEISDALFQIGPLKAPGPDGFIGTFFTQSWHIIKSDFMQAVEYFYDQHGQHLSHLNSAHIILIPKKADATTVTDFRPISLTHSIAKIFSKLLASRLGPELNALVSRAQSAFIKKRSIHDNFLYTQNLIKALHRSKQPGLFLKLDIAKAFDTVRWDYLMEVLEHFDFGSRWRGWVSALLATASTSVLLNGSREAWFKHYTGLRQGDPLSPMLFILAMEPLQRLLDLSTQEEVLSPINNRAATLRTSLYADDAAIFLNPIKEEVCVVAYILENFGKASGLITNHAKCAAYPIRCDWFDLNDILEGFTCPIKSFPCNYLGLP